MKDKAGYTPWKGSTVKGWPTTVLLRGEVLVENNKLRAKPGSGEFLARKAGEAAEPLGRATLEFDAEAEFRREAALTPLSSRKPRSGATRNSAGDGSGSRSARGMTR